MGRAIDLFVTYRFIRLLTTPFEDTDAFKLGIIDEKGNRVRLPKSTKPAVNLSTSELKNAYTVLHKLVFNIKKQIGNNIIQEITIILETIFFNPEFLDL